jgi:hypothetical protein
VLKKSVKAAGFGLNHVDGEFTSSDFRNKPVEYYVAACGAAATNVFYFTRLSDRQVFMQL